MSNLKLTQPDQVIDQLVSFIKTTFHRAGKTTAVIAVSGGIDSALSLTLVTKALGAKNIRPVFLPYGDQDTTDSKTIAAWNKIPEKNWTEQNIEWMVEIICSQLKIPATKTVRMGNVMARSRMITVYDRAKKIDGLVCGTENKSEHYLGYFTRFGDAASDLEPISQLYKTQVRQLVEHLGLPAEFLSKSPSAGLWDGQTDEAEMGFSYEVADQVLAELEKINFVITPKTKLIVPGVKPAIVKKIINQVNAMAFKRVVPYELSNL